MSSNPSLGEDTSRYKDAGSGGALKDETKAHGVPSTLLLEPRGPWRAYVVKVHGVSRKGNRTTRKRAVLEHLDGRRLREEPEGHAAELRRMALVLNGWEQARVFHPDHPERWRMQNALPEDPTQQRLDEALDMVEALVRHTGVEPVLEQGREFLRRYGREAPE